MIIVTGGAGFIGANLVRALNAAGETDILVVDNLAHHSDKFTNLSDLRIADFEDKARFREALERGRLPPRVRAVLHQGACSDTLERDGRYMLDNNFTTSKLLLEACQGAGVPLLYASSAAVYGAGTRFDEAPECERPLNVYGYSKLLFDQYLRARLPTLVAPVMGFRYFNVYGEREAHKGRMASMVRQMYLQLGETGQLRLFEGSDGYEPGEQSRDFVWVEDLVRVNLHFLEQPGPSGVYNLGSGRARSFNDLATVVVNARRHLDGLVPLRTADLIEEGVIGYRPFPEGVREKYQSFTCARLDALRAAGYAAPMTALEQGVPAYVQSLHAASDTA